MRESMWPVFNGEFLRLLLPLVRPQSSWSVVEIWRIQILGRGGGCSPRIDVPTIPSGGGLNGNEGEGEEELSRRTFGPVHTFESRLTDLSLFHSFPSSRTRKIRCDGAKPVCHNCSRRTATSSTNSSSSSNVLTSPTAGSPLSSTSPGGLDALGPCCYDAAPKRRGPDKNPGSRQRISHAQRDLEMLNGTVDGGKVRRRRRRDTTASTASTSVGATGTAQSPLSPSRGQPTAPIDNHLPSSLSDNLLVNTSVAGVGDGDLPTHGAAHSPVGVIMPTTSANPGIGTTVVSVSVAQPISAARASERGVPQLHLPPAHTIREMGQQAIPNSSTSSGVMGSPELYRVLPGRGQRAGAHGAAQSHSMSLSHAGEANVSEERSHHMHGDRHPRLQSAGNHRYSVSEPAYAALPVRVQIQVPSQAQHPRPHRADVSQLVSTSCLL